MADDDHSSSLLRERPAFHPAGNWEMPPRPSISELFHAEEGPLLRWAFGLTGRREVAEEVVQEAFLRLHQHWETVENPKAWIYRSARNLALNEMRDTGREHSTATPPEEAGKSPLPDQLLGRHEACGMLRLIMAEMEPQDRELVRLKYEEHLSYSEMAKRTGLTVGNVGYRLHHILKHLADALRRAGIESALG